MTNALPLPDFAHERVEVITGRRSGLFVAVALHSDPAVGLTEREAAVRLAEVGPNVPAPVERPGYLGIAARQFADPLVALLLAAAFVSVGIGERFEGAVIAAIVVLNAVLGFVQEAGAERALLALSRIRELAASVVRDGADAKVVSVGSADGTPVVSAVFLADSLRLVHVG